ncbi:MAG: sulfatase [Isosphaeraceae bacterium]|nr:sulfatase [Isosphaeraceae bacterium]
MNDAIPPELPESPAPEPESSSDSSPPRMPRHGGAILLEGLWFGMVAGLVELLLTIVLKHVADAAPIFFRLERHVVWKIPLVDLVVFATLALILALAARRISGRVPTFVFTSLAVFLWLSSRPRLFLLANVLLACGVGYRFSGRVERGGAWFDRIRRLSFAPLALLWAATFGWGFGTHVVAPRVLEARAESGRVEGRTGPNVLWIVLDTVRADRLGLYGSARPTSPKLDALAARGVVFESARSASPWTLPSHASMFTGQWAHLLSCDIETPLDAAHPTVAEFLASRGYATAGFVANKNYAGLETGVARGFERYADHELTLAGIVGATALGKQVVAPLLDPASALLHRDALVPRKPGARVRTEFLEWLDSRPADARPFFVFLNFFDAHDPYVPPVDHALRFGPGPKSMEERRLMYEWFIRDKRSVTDAERRLVNDAYDECIAALDSELGRLFDALAERGRLDDTLVIVTADHGEHFGEHDLYGHAASLYPQETHVPLVILPPGAAARNAGRRVAEAVSLRDLATTVASVVDPNGASPFPGRSLLGDAATAPSPAAASIDRPVLASPNQGRSPIFRGAMKSIIVDGYSYILNGDGVEELYLRASDPGELRNLADSAEHRPALEQARTRLQALLAGEPPIDRPRE